MNKLAILVLVALQAADAVTLQSHETQEVIAKEHLVKAQAARKVESDDDSADDSEYEPAEDIESESEVEEEA